MNNQLLGYAADIDAVRDISQRQPLVFPANSAPPNVSVSTTEWNDGMKTFEYEFSELITVKHIFTGNANDLQAEPDILFRDIQLHVELSRGKNTFGGNTLFLYKVHRADRLSGHIFTHFATFSERSHPVAIPWNEVPACLRQAQDFMVHRSTYYGETEGCCQDSLNTMAWVAPGRGQVRSVFTLLGSPH